MTKTTDQGTDRRTLLAAATAAGVVAAPVLASASPAMMQKGRGRPTVLKVDLGGLSLSEGQATELSNQISRLVLDAVAQAGAKVNNAGRVLGPHPGWYGIILRPAGENAYTAE